MADTSDWWLLVPSPIRRLPADLAAVLGLTIATVFVVVLPGVRETPLRVVFGLPFVLFLPGYALIAALFPETGESPAHETGTEDGEEAEQSNDRSGIDGIERTALSFGLSIAVVPLIGLVLNFTPFGIRLAPVLISVSGVTIALTVAAAYRRWALPPEDRFQVPYREWMATTRTELLNPDSRLDGVLTILMVVSILLAVSSVAYAVAVPQQGEAFTEHYLLTEQDNGTLVADDYPTEFTTGETRPIIVGIGNHEQHDVTYSVVVELQEVRVQNNSTTVLNEAELQRFQTRVSDGDTHHEELALTPGRTGERLRLVFLLYTDTPPADPTVENAYRETHLWVNVSSPQESIDATPAAFDKTAAATT